MKRNRVAIRVAAAAAAVASPIASIPCSNITNMPVSNQESTDEELGSRIPLVGDEYLEEDPSSLDEDHEDLCPHHHYFHSHTLNDDAKMAAAAAAAQAVFSSGSPTSAAQAASALAAAAAHAVATESHLQYHSDDDDSLEYDGSAFDGREEHSSCSGGPPPSKLSSSLSAVARDDPWVQILCESARKGHLNDVLRILSAVQSPTVSAVDRAFLCSAECGHAHIIEALASRVSSCASAQTAHGEPAIILSARMGHREVTELLLRLGVSIESRDANGDTPLLAAVEYNRIEMIRWLLDRNADVNATDYDHNSVLHVAACNGHAQVVHLLLRSGAIPDARNIQSETPIEFAKTELIVRIILRYCWEQSKTKSRAKAKAIPTQTKLSGALLILLWNALGIGKDNSLFQSFNIFPFDRLVETERIVAVDHVMNQLMKGGECWKRKELHRSTVYALFLLVKLRLRNELDHSHTSESNPTSMSTKQSKEWRERILAAYSSIYHCSAEDAGLMKTCRKRDPWNAVIDLLARTIFGPSYWHERYLFTLPNLAQRMKECSITFNPLYYDCHLPPASKLTTLAVQSVFKRLVYHSKAILCSVESNDVSSSPGCFCPQCMAERDSSPRLELHFIEETAEEKRKRSKQARQQKRSVNGYPSSSKNSSTLPIHIVHAHPTHTCHDAFDTEEENRIREQLVNQKTELIEFWQSELSLEEKYNLCEISLLHMKRIASVSTHWETLRFALHTYPRTDLVDELLQIDENLIRIPEHVGAALGVDSLFLAMLDAVSISEEDESGRLRNGQNQTSKKANGPKYSSSDKSLIIEWEKQAQQLLEGVVLCEFAKQVVREYLKRQDERRAKRVALELEQELLQEEEEILRLAEKKAKKKKGKKKRRSRKQTDGENTIQEAGRGEVDAIEERENDQRGEEESGKIDSNENHAENELVEEREEKTVTKKTKKKSRRKKKEKDHEKRKDAAPVHSEEQTKLSSLDLSRGEQLTSTTSKSTSHEKGSLTVVNLPPLSSLPTPRIADLISKFRNHEFNQILCSIIFPCVEESLSNLLKRRFFHVADVHPRLITSMNNGECVLFFYDPKSKNLNGAHYPHVLERDSGKEEFVTIWFEAIVSYKPLKHDQFKSHVVMDAARFRRLTTRPTRDLLQLFDSQTNRESNSAKVDSDPPSLPRARKTDSEIPEVFSATPKISALHSNASQVPRSFVESKRSPKARFPVLETASVPSSSVFPIHSQAAISPSPPPLYPPTRAPTSPASFRAPSKSVGNPSMMQSTPSPPLWQPPMVTISPPPGYGPPPVPVTSTVPIAPPQNRTPPPTGSRLTLFGDWNSIWTDSNSNCANPPPSVTQEYSNWSAKW